MKIHQQITGIFLIFTVFFGPGCGSNSNLSKTQTSAMPDHAQQVIAAQNNFSFKLFKLITQADATPSNKMISPLSIYLDLSMAYNGAAGSTREAMLKALQLEDVDTALLNKTSNSLINNLPLSDSSVRIDLAHSIWYRKSLQPLPSFLDINKNYYHAEIQPADFSNPQTINLINNWVADNTQQKIKSIVDHISPNDIMFLLNAVYFNGKWQKSFDPKSTQKKDFQVSEASKQVPFMYREDTYNYGNIDSLQVVELPYGNGNFSMYVLLPPKRTPAKELISTLSSASFSELKNRMDSSKVKLFLPKWESEYAIDDLTPELSNLGMGIAFGPQANFTRMYQNKNTEISSVVHKSYIKVDEEGTEAAAATSIGIRLTAVRQDSTPVMDVNRPFIYVITEKNHNSILFLGVVNNPEE